MKQSQVMTPHPHSTATPSKLALLNYHHQTQSGLQVGFQTSAFPQARTESSLPMTYSPALTQTRDIFSRPSVASSPPARLLSQSNMKSSQQSRRQHQTPPQISAGLLHRDTPSLLSPSSVLSVYSDRESLHSPSSTHTTALSEWAPTNSNPHVRHAPSLDGTFSPDRTDVDEAMEQANPDTALESRIPVRKIKTSVLDRPRPIPRGFNTTFSDPHAESDRLVQTVLKSSKSFDRGRRNWLAPPDHASIPPVPALPSGCDEAKQLRRQSSMINLPPPAYNVRNNDFVAEANFDHNMRIFDDRAPSLVLSDPSIYEATPTIASIPRRQLKDVIPHSLRKLKPKKGLQHN